MFQLHKGNGVYLINAGIRRCDNDVFNNIAAYKTFSTILNIYILDRYRYHFYIEICSYNKTHLIKPPPLLTRHKNEKAESILHKFFSYTLQKEQIYSVMHSIT